MKTRLVKKYSRIAKENPHRCKSFHMQYLMKSWRKSFGMLNDTEKYAIGKAMLFAFNIIDFARFVYYKKSKPTPRFKPGTHLIKNWEQGTPMREGEPVLIDGKWYMPADVKMSLPCNTTPPALLSNCQA